MPIRIRRDAGGAAAATPAQEATFTDLLAVGGPRPYASPGLVEDLQQLLVDGIRDPLQRWTEKTAVAEQGAVSSVLALRGPLPLADKEKPRRFGDDRADGRRRRRAPGHPAGPHPPGPPGRATTSSAVASLRGAEEQFEGSWPPSDMATQSDVLMRATSRVTAFLDSWPPLQPTWTPRFEEPIQAKAGRLTLSGRVTCCSAGRGRPAADHADRRLEVRQRCATTTTTRRCSTRWCARCATGCPPYRSTVYSLASGTFTDPDVTAERLRDAAPRVVAGVDAIVDVLTEQPRLQVLCGQRGALLPPRTASPSPSAATPHRIRMGPAPRRGRPHPTRARARSARRGRGSAR